MEHRDRNQDWILLIVGIAIVLFGARILFGSLPIFAPLRAVFDLIQKVAFPLVLVAAGVLLILYATRRDLFTRPDGRRLYRSRDQRVVAGVLGGLSEYFGWDVSLVRIVYVILAFVSGIGALVLLYIVAAIAIPEAPPGATVVPPSWPTTGVYTPPPNPPQAPWPPAPNPPAPGGPPTAPSVPEIPAPGAPVPPGQAYPPQAGAPTDAPPPPPPAPPAPSAPTPPEPPTGAPDEPTAPPANA